ncbi:hypothetical protein [Vibrio phage J14]|nr:hypothetical protein [Vibrio phage J14]
MYYHPKINTLPKGAYHHKARATISPIEIFGQGLNYKNNYCI